MRVEEQGTPGMLGKVRFYNRHSKSQVSFAHSTKNMLYHFEYKKEIEVGGMDLAIDSIYMAMKVGSCVYGL